MWKTIFIAVCLVVAPFFDVDGLAAKDTGPKAANSNVFIVSDFRGRLYLNGVPSQKIKAHSDEPVEFNLPSGNYRLKERVGNWGYIYSDFEVSGEGSTYIYLRPDGSRLGRTFEELNYPPVDRTWTYVIWGSAILAALLLGWGIWAGEKSLQTEQPATAW